MKIANYSMPDEVTLKRGLEVNDLGRDINLEEKRDGKRKCVEDTTYNLVEEASQKWR